MSTLLTPPLFRSVRSMLRASWRHCEIARETGLSVWTIDRIASDLRQRDIQGVGSQLRHRSLDVENRLPQLTEGPFPVDLPEDDAPPNYVAANLRRCPGCGGMVYQWPCLTCRLRASPRS